MTILHLQRTVGNNAVQDYLAYSQEEADTHPSQGGKPPDIAGFAKKRNTDLSGHNTIQTQTEEEEYEPEEIKPVEMTTTQEPEEGDLLERIIDPEEGSNPDTEIEMSKPPKENRGGKEPTGGPPGEKEPELIIDPEDRTPGTGIEMSKPPKEKRGGKEPGGSPTPTEPSVTQPHPTLYYGSRGPEVTELQGTA